MKKSILGKKLGMTQIFTEAGHLIPVTVVEAGPCVVVQRKTTEKDGYEALQVGFIDKKRSIKPEQGHFAKVDTKVKKYLRELRLEDCSPYNAGDVLKADVFEVGDKVDVSGTSKGKGFAGSIKRHNFSRGPMSHGSRYHRVSGSMGACSSPSRVFKNKKLPGQMGFEKVTVQNLQIVRVDAEKNLLLIKGAVPGAKGALLTIKNSVKNK